MNTLEKVVSVIAILGFVATVVTQWDRLNSRIDKVDEKIGEIQKTLGSTPCSAILTRELAAIDKGRADVRRSLDGLSAQYGCVTEQNEMIASDTATTPVERASKHAPAKATVEMDSDFMPANANASTAELNAKLKAVDAILSKKK